MGTKYCRKCGEVKITNEDNFCESCTKKFQQWLSEVDFRLSQNVSAFSYPKHHPIFQPEIKISKQGDIWVNDSDRIF